MDAKVIDISHWQGFPDFEAVKAAGVLGVIFKATEGTDYVDPNRQKNFSAAVKAGLACCCYFWLKPGDGASQAEFFLETIEPVEGERVVIDYEEDGCTLDTLKEAVAALLDADLDLKITVYSGHLLKEKLGDECDDFLAQHTDLWLAQYTDDFDSISWPEGTYPQWTLHQYSQTGSVPGVASDCDLDRFNGSDDELLAWINPNGGDQIEPPVAGRTVRVNIFAPPDVEVIVNVEHVEEVPT
jgi:lysozyme